MEKLLNGRLGVASGSGMGAGVLFAWFGSGMHGGSLWLSVIDSALAICTLTFFTLMMIGIGRATSGTVSKEQLPRGWRVWVGLLLCLMLLAGGVSLLLLVPADSGAVRTTTTWGVLLAGGGVLLGYEGIAKRFS